MESNNHIFLIGFMGVGKSTLGEKLALELKREFIDLDHLIEMNEKQKIRDIFEIHGESYFRELEKTYLMELVGNKIIATGGGILHFQETSEWLKENGTIIYLKAPFQELYSRILNDKTRPIAINNSKAQLESLYNDRDERYQSITDLQVSVSQCTVEQSVEKIIKGLNSFI